MTTVVTSRFTLIIGAKFGTSSKGGNGNSRLR
jgi:hypothetical protein